MKDKFIEIFKTHIKRDGANELLAYLLKTDFFEAPASTKYHLSKPGGLVEHSINVYNNLSSICRDKNYTDETIAICSLLHDVCKANFYAVEMRNRKNESTGLWEKYPFYVVNDELPYGHGEKSVYMISGFMRLNREEAMAIRWHMGAWENNQQSSTIGKAFEIYPLALYTHVADMYSTFIDEVSTEDGAT